jgi:hypothetical protein
MNATTKQGMVAVVKCIWTGKGFDLTLACGCTKTIGHIGKGAWGSKVMNARGLVPGDSWTPPYERARHVHG